MSRAHIHVKHDVRYGDSGLDGWLCEVVKDFLTKNGVCVFEMTTEDYFHIEWEMAKDELREIPERAYVDAADAGAFGNHFTEKGLRDFVQGCIDAPTGEWAHVSWF